MGSVQRTFIGPWGTEHVSTTATEVMKLKLGCSELNVHRLRFEKVPREKRSVPSLRWAAGAWM